MNPPQALRNACTTFPDPDAHRVLYRVDAWQRLFPGDADLNDLAARCPHALTRADVVDLARAALQGTTPVRRAFLAK